MTENKKRKREEEDEEDKDPIEPPTKKQKLMGWQEFTEKFQKAELEREIEKLKKANKLTDEYEKVIESIVEKTIDNFNESSISCINSGNRFIKIYELEDGEIPQITEGRLICRIRKVLANSSVFIGHSVFVADLDELKSEYDKECFPNEKEYKFNKSGRCIWLDPWGGTSSWNEMKGDVHGDVFWKLSHEEIQVD